MNLFGTTVDIDTNSHSQGASPAGEIVASVFRRSQERKLFEAFLASGLAGGGTVLDSVLEACKQEALASVTGAGISERAMLDFVLGELKRSANSHLSFYEAIKRKIIETENPKFAKLHCLIDRGEFDGNLPLGYPDASKKADGLLEAEIRDSLDERILLQYLERRVLASKIRELGRELFYAVNKLGLVGRDVVRYLRIIYELSLVETAPEEKPVDLRLNLGRAIKHDEILDLVHVKCLRFVYPIAGGFCVLTTQEDVVVDTILNRGKYFPKSEVELPGRVKKVRDIFEAGEVRTNLVLIVADDDVDTYFPQGTKLATLEQIKEARRDIAQFRKHLVKRFEENTRVVLMSELVRQAGEKYLGFKTEVENDIRREMGKYVNPERFERDRVDYLFGYFSKRFGSLYTRDEARRCAVEKTANVIALQELLPLLGQNIVMVEENMGGENKLIANGSVPIIFIKLRDEARFDVE